MATRRLGFRLGRFRLALLATIGAALLLASGHGGEPTTTESTAGPAVQIPAPPPAVATTPSPAPSIAPAPLQVAPPPATPATSAATAVGIAPTSPPAFSAGLDFGDAPEGGDAGYPDASVAAAFPSSLARDGARVRTTGEDSLGPTLTQEIDANAANADAADDGVSELLLDLATAPVAASLVTHVQIAHGAPNAAPASRAQLASGCGRDRGAALRAQHVLRHSGQRCRWRPSDICVVDQPRGLWEVPARRHLPGLD